MSVSGVSSTDSLYQINQQNGWQQVMNDFSQVGQSLQSGDLAGAQKAFATLQQNMQNVGQSQSGQSQSTQQQSALNQLGQALQSGGAQGTSGDSGGSSTIGNDLNTLATALQSGDLTGAQQAFTSLMQDAQTAAANFCNSSQTNGNIVNTTARFLD